MLKTIGKSVQMKKIFLKQINLFNVHKCFKKCRQTSLEIHIYCTQLKN